MLVPKSIFVFIDIFVIALFLIFMIIGYKKGFFYELLSLVYTALSCLGAWFLAPIFANLYPIIKLKNITTEIEIINKFVDLEAVLNSIVYFVIVFLLFKLLYIILVALFKGVNKVPVVGKLNKFFGLLVGVLNAAIVSLLLSMLLTLPIFKNGNEIINGTVFKYVNKYSETILSYTIDNINLDHMKEQFDSFDVNAAREQFKEYLDFKNS